MLQMIDPHTHQYLDRLKDEPVFLAMAAKMSDAQAARTEARTLARLALRRLEHFYHKTSDVYEAMRKITTAQQQADAAAVAVRLPQQACHVFSGSCFACCGRAICRSLRAICDSSPSCL